MKRTLIVTTAVLVALGFGILLGARTAQTPNTSAALAAPAPAAMAVPAPARCPNIHEAIGTLESAMRDMREARHDFCGHKREAMEAAHRAIEQLRLAEECDACR